MAFWSGLGLSGGMVATGAAAAIAVAGFVGYQFLAEPEPAPDLASDLAPEAAPVPSEPASATSDADPQPADPTAAPQTETAATADAPPPIAPSFDLVRVDAAGGAVIAGRAEPGADLRLRLDGEEVHLANSDGAGAFVAMFAIPPSDLPQVLSLEMMMGDGQVLISEQSVIIQPARQTASAGSGADAVPDLPDPGEDSGAISIAAADSAPVTTPPLAPDLAPDLSLPDLPGTASTAPTPPDATELAALAPEPAGTAPELEDPQVTPPESAAPEAGAEAAPPAAGAEQAAEAPPLAEAAADAATDAAQAEPAQTILAEAPTQPEADSPGTDAPGTAPAATDPEDVPPVAEADPIPDPIPDPTLGPTPGPATDPAQLAGAQPAGADLPDPQEGATSETIDIAGLPEAEALSPPTTLTPPTEPAAADTAPDSAETPQTAPDTAPTGPTPQPGQAPDPPQTAETGDNSATDIAAVADGPQPPPADAAGTGTAPEAGADTTPAGNGASQPDTPEIPTVMIADSQGIRVVQAGGPAPQVQVVLDTIAYDAAGEVVLTGRGPAQSDVRLYLDNQPVQLARIDGSGGWSTQLPQVDPGTYTLRVDEVSEAGDVLSRVETPFLREEQAVLEALPERDGVSVITVQPGHTLWGISRDHLGDGALYVQVYQANRDLIRDPHWIYPGQIFALPDAPQDP